MGPLTVHLVDAKHSVPTSAAETVPRPAGVHPVACWALLLGVLALVCFGAGPLLGPLAIVLGIVARRQIARAQHCGEPMTGSAMATAGILSGGLGVLCFGIVAGLYWKMHFAAAPGRSTSVSLDDPHVALVPPDPSAPPSASSESPQAPSASTVSIIGSITVVDVAGGVPSLARELEAQRMAAASHGQKMLVETVAPSCAPCRGIDTALGDPRMQKALHQVRLVRIDRSQFEEDLDELEIPTKPWPTFFLLDTDLHVRDSINGEEWDEDVAANIAPVLGPFVRGTYTNRRTPPRHVPRPSGTVL